MHTSQKLIFWLKLKFYRLHGSGWGIYNALNAPVLSPFMKECICACNLPLCQHLGLWPWQGERLLLLCQGWFESTEWGQMMVQTSCGLHIQQLWLHQRVGDFLHLVPRHGSIIKTETFQQKQNNSIQLIGPLVIKEIPKISNNGQIIWLCCVSNAKIISMSVTEGSKYNTVLTL